MLILLEYEHIKIFLRKDTLQIGLKIFLWLKKLKILCWGHVINDPNGKEIIGIFYKNKSKTNQKQFRVEKVLRKKGDKCMLNEKDTIIPLIAT